MRVIFLMSCLSILTQAGNSVFAQEVGLKNFESLVEQFGKFNELELDSSFIKSNAHYDSGFIPLGPLAHSIRELTYKPDSFRNSESELWIKFRNVSYQYRDGAIYTLNSEDNFVPLDINQCKKIVRRTVRYLSRLESASGYAQNIIRTLQNYKNKFVIALTSLSNSFVILPLPENKMGFLNNNAYAFQILEKGSLMVDYAPFNKIGSGAEIRWTPRLGIMALAHELSHAFDANYGLLDDRLMYAYREVMSAREIRALFHENMIRKEMDKKFRIDAKTGRALFLKGKPYTYPLPTYARY